MQVELLNHTPLSTMVKGGRTCWDSHCRGGVYREMTDNIDEVDMQFLDRIVNKHKHGSVSEHVVYNFYIEGISRAALQELARHRHASLSVKSTRYTLKELKDEEEFKYEISNIDSYIKSCDEEMNRIRKYIRLVGDGLEFFPRDSETLKKIMQTDNYSIQSLELMRKLVSSGGFNDCIKYNLPESYKTTLMWTINARSLKNFLELRSSPSALWEMRLLAGKIRDTIPNSHRFLYI